VRCTGGRLYKQQAVQVVSCISSRLYKQYKYSCQWCPNKVKYVYIGKADSYRDGMSQRDSGNAMNSLQGRYCSISDVMKLINQPFAEDKQKLKEFVDNVSTAFKLVNPNEHDLLLKFVQTKITGEARSKLLVRDLTSTWRDVEQILEENYGVRRTLGYYACRMFGSRQGADESIASWSTRIDAMQSELREAAYSICEDEEVIGAMRLINP